MLSFRDNSKLTICDDCSLVAYDLGIGSISELDYDDRDEFEDASQGAWQTQVDFMVEVGRDAVDHVCSANMEPDLDIQCDCGCRESR